MNVYLRKLQLKNFQSWENEQITFSNGLNCIIARNGVGKSVIYKALQVTVLPNKYSKEDKRDFIRGSAQFAEIYYLFSDNSLYVVKFSETKNLGVSLICLNSERGVNYLCLLKKHLDLETTTENKALQSARHLNHSPTEHTDRIKFLNEITAENFSLMCKKYINEKKIVSIQELVPLYGVREATIRRDIV